MTTDPFVAPSDRQPGEFRRTKMGAPRVTRTDEPDKYDTYGRPSGFGIDPNPYNLIKWKERQLVIGLLALYDIDIDPEDRDALDRIANDANDAANSSLAADRGTHVHLLCERVDNGEGYIDLLDVGELLGIPSSLQEHIVKSWLLFRQKLGVEADGVEINVVCDALRLAGTADRHDRATCDLSVRVGERLVNIPAGSTFIGDIKTGKLATTRDGHPKYWVKYGPQIAAYCDGVPYDVDTEERGVWEHTPNPHVALLYHYDLSAALDGETVEWQAIPVDLEVARIGCQVALDAKAYAKRRDVFGPPIVIDRRQGLLDRYSALSTPDQETFRALDIDKDDLDEIEAAIAEREVDAFDRVAPLPEPRHEPTEVAAIFDDGDPVTPDQIDTVLAEIKAGTHRLVINRWALEARNDGTSFDPRHHRTERHLRLLSMANTIAYASDGDDDIARMLIGGCDTRQWVGVLIADTRLDEINDIIDRASRFGDTPLVIAEDGTPTISPDNTALFG